MKDFSLNPTENFKKRIFRGKWKVFLGLEEKLNDRDGATEYSLRIRYSMDQSSGCKFRDALILLKYLPRRITIASLASILTNYS